MGIWTLDSPFSLITLDRRTRLLLLLRNLNQSRLEAVRLISGCKCHRLPNLYLYFVAVELLIQVVLYQITLFHYQLILSMTTDYPPINDCLKFIYSEKGTKFCKIFPLLLTLCTVVKSEGKILLNFVAFSEYMNFKKLAKVLY